MEKAKLSKEQAAALESAIDCSEKKSHIIENHISGLWSGPRKPLHELSLERLIVALYIGYEIERSKEDKLLDFIRELQEKAAEQEIISSSKLLGVMKTLEILGIELIEPKEVKTHA